MKWSGWTWKHRTARRIFNATTSSPPPMCVACPRARARLCPRLCAPRLRACVYRDFLVVALILETEDLFPDNWIYIHTPGVRVGRIQNFNNWSAAMVPIAGTNLPRHRVLLFRGRRAVDESSDDEAHRAGGTGAGATRPGAEPDVGGRHGDPHAQGVSHLRRRVPGASRHMCASRSIRSPTCTRSGATECTSTTTTITPCYRR